MGRVGLEPTTLGLRGVREGAKRNRRPLSYCIFSGRPAAGSGGFWRAHAQRHARPAPWLCLREGAQGGFPAPPTAQPSRDRARGWDIAPVRQTNPARRTGAAPEVLACVPPVGGAASQRRSCAIQGRPTLQCAAHAVQSAGYMKIGPLDRFVAAPVPSAFIV